LHYEILDEIGRGGMGVVYRAKDVRLGRIVALKLLKEHKTRDERGKKRLLQEAQSASSLNHPNILTIYDIGQANDLDFIVMEFVDGETLEERLEKGPLSEEAAVSIALQLTQGLGAAHDIGVFHRDIKPANIMLTDRGRVKIMDFGLAQISDTSSITVENGVVGTAAYMSPEQARGEKIDARTDVWSLGVVLYQMISGTRPFHGAYMPALIYSVLNEDPAPLSATEKPPSSRYVELVEACLTKQVDHRISTMRDVEAVLNGSSTEYGGAPVSRFSSVKAKRMTWGVLAILFLAAIFMIGRPAFWPGPAKSDTIKRVALLPIRSIGENKVTDQLIEGLYYSIASQLTSLHAYQKSFSVIPAAEILSQIKLTDTASDLPFDADIVVTGSIQRFDNIVQLRFELTDPSGKTSLNAIRLDADIENLLVFQDEAALELAKVLEPSVSLASSQPIAPGSTLEPGAYDFYLRGEGYLQRFTSESDVDAAISLFKSAIAEDSTYALAFAGLGEAYWRKFNLTKDNAWTVLAEKNALAALSITDDLARVQETLGLIQREQGRYDSAEIAFKKAITLDPSGVGAHVELGVMYGRMKRWADAENAIQTAIRLRPDFWYPHNELGRVYFLQGRYGEAALQFQKVVQLAPDNENGYNNIAVSYERMGEVEKSIPWFEKGISVLKTPMLYRNLGSIYFYDQHNFGKATSLYQQAVDENELDYKSWAVLAEGALQAEETPDRAFNAYERTVALSREALRVNPSDPEAMGALVEALSVLGRDTEARVSLESMKRLSVLDFKALLSIAISHEVLGDRDSSLVYVQRALEDGVNPKYVMKAPILNGLRADRRFEAPSKQ